MKYLFLMFYRYYSTGKNTKDIPYVSTLGAVGTYIFLFILNIFMIFNIDFEIPYRGIARWLDYILIAIETSPIVITLLCLYPPKKVKQLNESFKYNIYKNIFWITVLIVLFFGLAVHVKKFW